ncbi:MAG: hypothetical protein RL336_554 [Pseudomonadota bacterium]
MATYKVWECIVCGFIYDESLGLPEEGIAPGTRWEDVPEDWLCPECGVGKLDFEMIEVKEVAITSDTTPTDDKVATTQVADTPIIDTPASAPLAASGEPFKVWECIVCGWEYDEALGWPEDGIAPGTRWEDVPEDWACPECGVGKLDFEMVAVSEHAPVAAPSAVAAPAEAPIKKTAFDELDNTLAPVVIIGSGLAGYNLARMYRQQNKQRPLLMLSQDDASFYSKPALSTGMHKGKTAIGLVTKEAEQMARDLGMDIRPFCDVSAIDPAAQTVNTNHGRFGYHQLVLATGSIAIRPPMEGDAADKVHQVNNLHEYAAFRTAMAGAKRVVIIGAGLIGAEFCNDLVLSGHHIDIIDPLPHMLGNLIPAPASQVIEEVYRGMGVNMHFGLTAQRVDQRGRGYRVTLANGETIDCDAVLSAVGVRPNTALAEASGITIARGIVTNEFGQTNHANIYALGDCAELGGQVRLYVAPLVTSADAIAATLNGNRKAIELPAMPVTIKTTHHPVVVVPVARDAEGEWIVDQRSNEGVAARFVAPDGQVVGFALTGKCTAEKDRYGVML